MCPGEGLHVGVCALKQPNADTTKRAEIKNLVIIPAA
jgi:hypothetical protein